MQRIWILALVTFASCYDPELRDCTVTCGSPGDCISGQVCGSDGYCAAPDVAGKCKQGPAPVADAHPSPPDAVPTAELHISINGMGRVADASGMITCVAPPPGGCTFTVRAGASITLTAIKSDHDFDRWTTPNCAGQDESCTLTVVAPTTMVGVKFK
jgi:hypothetical protein